MSASQSLEITAEKLNSSMNVHEKQLIKSTIPVPAEDKISGMSNYPSQKPPDLHLPKFSGENPMSWIRKCNVFFKFHPMDDYAKVSYASFFLESKAEIWFLSNVNGRNDVNWEMFCDMLMERFSEIGAPAAGAKLRKLKQESNLATYLEEFESLISFVKFSALREEFVLCCFVEGLKAQLKTQLLRNPPNSLREAIRMAKLEERLSQIDDEEERPSQSDDDDDDE